MRITFTERFERDLKKLSDKERDHFCSVLPKIPKVLGNPHVHSRIGLRKLHPSGIYEARIGLHLRVVFGMKKNEMVFHRLGDHEAVQSCLKNL